MASVRSIGERDHDDLIIFRLGFEAKVTPGALSRGHRQVTIQANRLFRVDLPFPSRLPEGVYEIRTYLVRHARSPPRCRGRFRFGKVGFSASLRLGWSHGRAPLYGLGVGPFAG